MPNNNTQDTKCPECQFDQPEKYGHSQACSHYKESRTYNNAQDKKIKESGQRFNPLKILIDGSIEREYYEYGKQSAVRDSKREIDELEKWVVVKIFALREKNREYKKGFGVHDELYIKAFEEVLVKIVTGK